MGVGSNFERDFQETIQFFPKLKYRRSKKEKIWIVSGDLDICDQAGDYWETFMIAIYLSSSYPYCVPEVRELSRTIEREDNWHIDKNGFCCLDIEHRMLLLAKRGISLADFIKNKVYPYFANQIFKKNEGNYASGEYLHNFEGIKQFYREELNIRETKFAIDILQRIISKRLPLRNDPCPCGQDKYKRCHMNSVELLRSLPLERIEKDLDEFSKIDR